jgi:nucleoside-diphosphate-sugar epimerase
MGDRKRDKANVGDDEPPTVGDMADEAEKQMPGKPPNLAFDPSKRNEELARAAGDRALAEAEEKLRRKKKK